VPEGTPRCDAVGARAALGSLGSRRLNSPCPLLPTCLTKWNRHAR